ncbi:MAG TPA: hypothetical protein VJ644_12960 [Jiangellaceae bacterium]|nr:hypothetical protein [Jiangellaceae bacterium]
MDEAAARSAAVEASSLLTDGAIKPHSIDLAATSRPYLQVVNYGTANWMRLWLLGIDEGGRNKVRGSGSRRPLSWSSLAVRPGPGSKLDATRATRRRVISI